MSSRVLAKKLYIEKFRKLNEIDINIGKNLTLISGYNGIGKSNILSLIASGSGKKVNKQIVDSNFQPEFYYFFHINEDELTEGYNSYIYYGYDNQSEEEGFVKRLSLKDDTKDNRGIRIIPRLHNRNNPDITIKSIAHEVKKEYGVSIDSRVPIPTIFLSLSRLYPIGETDIKSSKLFAHNSFNTKDADKKYAEWYNSIIPNSIDINNSNVYAFEKTATKKSSTYMDLQSTTIKTQSIGQDNIGNIVSALTDFYLLSLEDDYTGGILCIDEIDVSLHPNIQINMINLLDELSRELKLQIILSTHSLILIKEILKLQHKNSTDDYSLVYLKNFSLPMVSNFTNYKALKADLYSDYSILPTQIKVYFEDPITQIIFNLLLDSYKYILNKVSYEREDFYENLRSSQALTESNKDNLTKRILKFKEESNISSHLNIINIQLGCDNLLQLNNKDSYFNTVLIILDGDARTNPDKNPKVSEHLTSNELLKSLNTRKVAPNIVFLPTFFAPESYLYRIVYEFTENQLRYLYFWRSLDNLETMEYSNRDYVRGKIIIDDKNFNNDDIKKNQEYLVQFVQKTRLLQHYYMDYNNIVELLTFMEDLIKSFNIVRIKVESNRYDI